MIQKAVIKRNILHKVKRQLALYVENAYYNETAVNARKVLDNLDEAASIMAVDNINWILDLYKGDSNNWGFYMNEIFSSSDLNEIRILLESYDIKFLTRGTLKRDVIVKKIYRNMGFYDTLPTHNEIVSLQFYLGNPDLSDEEYFEILKQIELKKLALGELKGQMEGGFPVIFSPDIERKYQLKINRIKNDSGKLI